MFKVGFSERRLCLTDPLVSDLAAAAGGLWAKISASGLKAMC